MRSYVLFFVLLIVVNLSLQHAVPFMCERLNITEIRAGERSRISFMMRDFDYGLFLNETGLAVYHDRKMHVVIISDSWDTFQHIHPTDFGNFTEMSDNGAYYIESTFPNSGGYMMNVDFVYINRYGYPVEGYCQFNFNVTGGPAQVPPVKVPVASPGASIRIPGLPLEDQHDRYVSIVRTDELFSAQQNEYSIQVSMMPMSGSDHHMTNPYFLVYNCIMIELSVNDTNGPVTDLAPYMNAVIHAAFVHNGTNRIWHTHGMGMMNHDHSMNMCDVDVSPAMLNYTETGPFGPKAIAYFVPEWPGLWQGFLQLKHNKGENGTLLLPIFQLNVVVEAPATSSSSTDHTTDHSSTTDHGSMTTDHGSMTTNHESMTTDHSTDHTTMDMGHDHDSSANQFVFSFFVLSVVLFLVL